MADLVFNDRAELGSAQVAVASFSTFTKKAVCSADMDETQLQAAEFQICLIKMASRQLLESLYTTSTNHLFRLYFAARSVHQGKVVMTRRRSLLKPGFFVEDTLSVLLKEESLDRRRDIWLWFYLALRDTAVYHRENIIPATMRDRMAESIEKFGVTTDLLGGQSELPTDPREALLLDIGERTSAVLDQAQTAP
ncbi:hypothetical protein AW923_14280 [Pseudomonas aeruginosa]|nr:hypothetical protein AW918_13540 [Pseudomonas aeruginosa]KXE19001.1 hypothetical protein AW920_13775 [Pseudomonas aeruginosa]KXE30323.1 hypothetical protein AW921_14210 [Pseudomonas aeruginosa]KXE34553.1 hypothetical protein AW922_14250 [Pseudomonas aeruginosa]KXE43923.1 hypothetical protein AW923_14280 [Pseudomonas aeruginosa]